MITSLDATQYLRSRKYSHVYAHTPAIADRLSAAEEVRYFSKLMLDVEIDQSRQWTAFKCGFQIITAFKDERDALLFRMTMVRPYD